MILMIFAALIAQAYPHIAIAAISLACLALTLSSILTLMKALLLLELLGLLAVAALPLTAGGWALSGGLLLCLFVFLVCEAALGLAVLISLSRATGGPNL